MISCYVLDDERSAIDILVRYIQDTPYLQLVGSSHSSTEALDFLRSSPVDLLFLDIQMPKLTGLQFLDVYKGRTQVIFTTAYSEYALEGYERSVVDYLLKPIPYSRFLKATEKALNILTKEVATASTEKMLTDDDFILVKTEHKGKLRKINLKEIVYVEGLKNYVSLHTDKRERIVTYIGIGELEERLPEKMFVRVHRSYIVAIAAIQAIDGNEIIMKDAPRIPTSGKFKDDLFDRFQKQFLQLRKAEDE